MVQEDEEDAQLVQRVEIVFLGWHFLFTCSDTFTCRQTDGETDRRYYHANSRSHCEFQEPPWLAV